MLRANPGITRLLVRLFETRFDPAAQDDAAELCAKITAELHSELDVAPVRERRSAGPGSAGHHMRGRNEETVRRDHDTAAASGQDTAPANAPQPAHPWVIGFAAGLYLIEFFADKFPYFDTIWDFIHTFIRPPAAAPGWR